MPLDKHHKISYAVAAVALAASLYSANVAHKPVNVTVAHETGGAVESHGRHEWPQLGEAVTIKLGEALQAEMKPNKVTIYCASSNCHKLATDLDDAFQIAQWDTDAEDRLVDSESDVGLFVGPPGAPAEHLKDAIEKATGIDVEIVPIGGIDGLGVIIGKVKHEKN